MDISTDTDLKFDIDAHELKEYALSHSEYSGYDVVSPPTTPSGLYVASANEVLAFDASDEIVGFPDTLSLIKARVNKGDKSFNIFEALAFKALFNVEQDTRFREYTLVPYNEIIRSYISFSTRCARAELVNIYYDGQDKRARVCIDVAHEGLWLDSRTFVVGGYYEVDCSLESDEHLRFAPVTKDEYTHTVPVAAAQPVSNILTW